MGTTLKFYINKSKRRKKDNRYPIYLRVIHNLKKAEGRISLIPIKYSDVQYWIEESQRFNANHKKFLTHNIFLNEVQNKFCSCGC